ncbi:lipoate--protein ligase A [Geotalea daltonii FRC-32]|uniref:Lipoate--protein ligase A n=2 Tax=Geotalea TaxID=2910589 RepID=B9M4F3_GEODF|nr:lipoate--protein ligase A [Geotalea daltonii FRC-32]
MIDLMLKGGTHPVMTIVGESWRFIDTGPLDGPANMAVDEALLEHFHPETSQPVLRLYGWHPPAFSLGRYQQAAEVLDLELCAERGVPVVRRITGGGLIYHAEELTYSIVCAPKHIAEAGTVKESFARLCGFLIRTYGRLGLKAGFAVDNTPAGTRLGGRTAFCFAGKEEYDVVVAGRKLGGNAQRRTKRLIFQHGSMPLRPALSSAIPFLREKMSALDKSTASLAELGVAVDEEALKQTVAECFAETMGVILQTDALTAGELETGRQLEEKKYGSFSWNAHGITG